MDMIIYLSNIGEETRTMKLRVQPWRLIWRFLVALLVIYAVSFGAFISLFFSIDFNTWVFTPVVWDYRQPLLIIGIFVIGVAAFIPSLTSCYYICDKHSFIMKRYWKTYEFDYANIKFIDIDESKRKKMVIFWSTTARMKYLLGDKDGVLLDTLIKKCPDIMSKEEFRRAHPEERY